MATEKFLWRHIGPRPEDIENMLKVVGVSSLDELIEQTVPESIRLKKTLDLPAPLTEFEFISRMKAVASKNKLYRTFIGQGYYDTITPAVIQRNILENPAWYTSYTPYQAEVSQGRLEALLNFQTMVVELTGMEISNCSLLDEATAAAESMTMMYGLRGKEMKKAGANKLFVDNQIFPQTKDVLITRSARRESSWFTVIMIRSSLPRMCSVLLSSTRLLTVRYVIIKHSPIGYTLMGRCCRLWLT